MIVVYKPTHFQVAQHQNHTMKGHQEICLDSAELNNNNNNKVAVEGRLSVGSDSTSDSGSVITTTPQKPVSVLPTPDSPERGLIGLNTWRKKKIKKEQSFSLKMNGDETIGLENVVPYHRSPKALSAMGKYRNNSNIYALISTKFIHLARGLRARWVAPRAGIWSPDSFC